MVQHARIEFGNIVRDPPNFNTVHTHAHMYIHTQKHISLTYSPSQGSSDRIQTQSSSRCSGLHQTCPVNGHIIVGMHQTVISSTHHQECIVVYNLKGEALVVLVPERRSWRCWDCLRTPLSLGDVQGGGGWQVGLCSLNIVVE